ncbi:SusC/RagA family TonB-linked outer membrane protein [Pedobacter sp. HMWF019]|uniref:SusC/RagA family TonB-linked outer membrane protein n=1 Tax=Pedobacter sp. HMWF019 TaxID=2056856 RepID=UPI000D335912|nr:SusC/RagA family TonB-linked outer membrane protein [Pedobacter sp. HMWF019]PTS96358.1 SusC/RagA family TonB-linked outer membrane protein [Pedobacter sp. HMWF019]
MRRMKVLILSVILLLFTNAYAQTKVDLNLHTNNFEKVINAIKKQTIYHFIYNQNNLPKKEIKLKIKGQETTQVLEHLLENTGFTYTLLPNNLIVISAAHEDISRSMAAETVKVDSNQLEEVVITALNITKEVKRVGYSVTTIKGEEFTKAREANFVLAMEGKVAGLNVSGVSGGPSSSSRLLLRGAASMSAGSPLYVLNGVPIDNTQRGSATEYGGADYGDGISNLNPDDIQSVTVLKGSAASALYGARAANGVILVITKTGIKNATPQIEYNMNLSFDHALNNTDYQYLYGQGTQNRRPSDMGSAVSTGLLSWGEKMDGKPVIQFNGKTEPYSPVKDNIKQFYRTAPSWVNTVSASGGTARSAFRISASNMDYAAVIPNSSLNRKTFNLTAGYDITPKLNVNFSGNYIYEMSKNRSYLSDGPMNANYGIQFLATSASQSSLKPGYNPITGVETAWNNDEYKTNPYFVINKQVDDTKRNRFISATAVKYSFSDRLYLQGRFGYDISNDHLLNVLPTGTAFTINQQGALNALNEVQTSELNADFLAVTQRDLTEYLSLNFSAGANFRKRRSETLGYIGAQFITPYLYTPSNLQSINSTYTVLELATESAYYTADLSFHKYLNFSLTGRYDIYSTLPSNNRGIFVPGFSGSFVFSELLHLPWIDYGKLRMSFAKTSGEPAQPYTTQTYYSSNTSVNGIPLGDFSRILPNFNLKPFVLNEYETGFNLVFFNSRLGLDFTYFHRITNNEITNVEQSVTTGFNSSYVNLGRTRNTGVEVLLYGMPLKSKDFKWDVSFNFSHVNNKLLSIDGSSTYILTGKYRPLNANTAMVLGESITQIMAYDYKRDPQGNIIIDNTGIPMRGEFKPMGGTLPIWYGGWSNTFQYKNFKLSGLIDFKFGNKVLSASENYSYVYGLNKATLEGREGGVVAKGVLADGSINTINVPAYNYYPQLVSNISALSVLNGSFIKFRQLSFGYTFVPRFAKAFKSVSIDLVGRNLLTILKYTHNIDPESQFAPSLAYAGIEGSSLPAVRTYGINLNFKLR